MNIDYRFPSAAEPQPNRPRPGSRKDNDCLGFEDEDEKICAGREDPEPKWSRACLKAAPGGILTLALSLMGASLWATAGWAATVQWYGGGDGTNWNQALNWVGDVTPGATNDVVIDVPGTNVTVNI